MGLGGSIRQYTQPTVAQGVAPPAAYGSAMKPQAAPSSATPARGLGGSAPQSAQMQTGGSLQRQAGVLNNQYRGSGPTPFAPHPTGMVSDPGLNQGVATGGGIAQPNPYAQQGQGGSLAEIQAEMARRNVGVQLNANPANSALAGYMLG